MNFGSIAVLVYPTLPSILLERNLMQYAGTLSPECIKLHARRYSLISLA